MTVEMAMELAERLVGCNDRTLEEDALVVLYQAIRESQAGQKVSR